MSGAPTGVENLPFAPGRNRENDKSAGKWTGAALGERRAAAPHLQPQPSAATKPGFQIHQDDSATKEQRRQPEETPRKFDSRLG